MASVSFDSVSGFLWQLSTVLLLKVGQVKMTKNLICQKESIIYP
jgi:hypothetical protein